MEDPLDSTLEKKCSHAKLKHLNFYFSDQQGSGTATKGVFTYFFWVLLQPFRGNPEYHDVADLPYNSTCLEKINSENTDMKSLSKYNTVFVK